MVHAEESVIVSRSCAETFAVISDLSGMPAWRGNVASAEWVGDTGPGEGADRIRAVTQMLGLRFEWTCDVIAYDPPHRFEYVACNGTYVVTVAFRCEPRDAGCRVTMTGGGDVPGGKVGGLAAPLYVKALLRENRTSLRKLKLLVESVANAG